MIKMAMIIAMIMVSLTASKKPNFFSNSKGIHFFILNLKTSTLCNCLISNGTKCHNFGPKNGSDSVLR